MSAQRFAGWLEALLQAGVARRHAQRALQELENHFDDLVAAARVRGLDRASATAEAQRMLGTQADLVRAYASRPELRSWSRRGPVLFFMLLPLLTYAMTAVLSLLLLTLVAERNSTQLHRLHISAAVTHGIDATAQVIVLWLLPCVIGGAFALFAHRRRAPARWAMIAIIGVSILASLCNVAVSISGGDIPGQIGAGIGISWATLPERLTHAALLALPAVLLWRFAARPRANSDMHPVL